MRIAVDVMGGDYAPGEIVAGALMYAGTAPAELLLVGQAEVVTRELQGQEYDPARIRIVNASQIMGMDEPVTALRTKQDSSIVVATRLVKEGQADAVISCGSTAAQMAAATLILGRIEGIERPPIIARIPGLGGKDALLLDVGANVDCKPAQLLQFAQVGRVYASILYGMDNPRVALLNNGEEEGKGNSLTLETHNLLKTRPELNFIGNIEGRDLFFGKTEVAVCDGFTGNLILKSLEGLAMLIGAQFREEAGQLPKFFSRLDYSQAGGAPLLGVKGISIVCHGSSKRGAVAAGINIAAQCVRQEMVKAQMLALQRTL